MAHPSTFHIIDDARNHFKLGRGFRGGLPLEQAYLHIGIFLGWVIENNLYSDFFAEEGETAIFRFKYRAITPIILGELWDGVIAYEQLNPKAKAFAASYYTTGQYLEDYQIELAQGLRSIYEVEDTEFNYQRMCKVLTKRFKSWKKKYKKSVP